MQGIKMIDGSFAFIRSEKTVEGTEYLEVYDPIKHPNGLLLPKKLCKQDEHGRWEQVHANFSQLFGTGVPGDIGDLMNSLFNTAKGK